MTERRIGNAESEVASPQVSMLFKLDCSTALIVSCLINGSCRKYKVMLKSCWTPMQEVLNWFVWLPCFQSLSFLLFFRVIYSFCRVLKMRIHFEYLTPKHFDFAFPTVISKKNGNPFIGRFSSHHLGKLFTVVTIQFSNIILSVLISTKSTVPYVSIMMLHFQGFLSTGSTLVMWAEAAVRRWVQCPPPWGCFEL